MFKDTRGVRRWCSGVNLGNALGTVRRNVEVILEALCDGTWEGDGECRQRNDRRKIIGQMEGEMVMIVIGCRPPRTLAERRSCFRCQVL